MTSTERAEIIARMVASQRERGRPAEQIAANEQAARFMPLHFLRYFDAREIATLMQFRTRTNAKATP